MTRRLRLGMLRAVIGLGPRALLALTISAFAGGCIGGTETGNPPFQAELAYTAYSSTPLLIGVRESGSQAVVDSAWLDLGAVALLGAGSCEQPESSARSVRALGIGDHAAGQHNATRFELTASEYCALELPFLLASPGAIQNDVPADLERHSIMLAGKLADGTPFTLLSAATPRVRLNADAGSFSIDRDQARTLIAFDVAQWLTGLDWAGATRSEGAIHISADDNPALLAQFESNLGRGIALYRDADGDGKVDDDPLRLAHGE